MQNPLEGKKFIGVIVAGSDNEPDPQQMGRVKVAVPSIQQPSIDVSMLPWVQIGSPGKDGSFDRPPQEGTLVSIYYPGGSKSSMLGTVEYVYNGIHNPVDLPNNLSLVNMGWFQEARTIASQFSKGFAEVTQTLSGITLTDKPAASMKMLEGVPSNKIAKTLVTPYEEIKNVATAETEGASAATPSINSLIPGLAFSLSSLLTLMPTALKNELLGSLPTEVSTGLNNLMSIMGSYSPVSGRNFTQTGTRIDSSTFFTEALNGLKNVQSFAQLENALQSVVLNRDNSGLSSVSQTISGPFGDMSLTIGTDGTISLDSSAITDAIQAFLSIFTSIQTGLSGMLSNAPIDDMMARMSDSGAEIKTKITANATALASPFAVAQSFFGGA